MSFGKTNTNNLQNVRNMQELIADIFLHIKAFDGDIFGGAIRDYKTLNIPYVKDVNCRIDTILLNVFIQTLHIHFEVVESPLEIDGRFVLINKKLRVALKDNKNVATCINIVIMSRVEWLRLPCDFDVNILAENASSLFVRSSYVPLNRFVDKLGYITKRINDMVFAQLESTSNKTPDEINYIVDRAVSLVDGGWTMDDNILGKEGFVVNTWKAFVTDTKNIRTSYDSAKLKLTTSHRECSLCNEEFEASDIVINTCCNHNFHWDKQKYNQSNGCRGLSEWVNVGKTSCPLCRKSMF